MAEHTRGFGGGGEDSGRRLSPERGASSMLLVNPQAQVFTFSLLPAGTVNSRDAPDEGEFSTQTIGAHTG